MTTSDPKKMLTQLNKKPQKLKRFKKYNLSKIRSCGRVTAKCQRCGRTGVGGFVGKYKLKFCRCCFREIATDIGFKKYS
jgi:small subunit ribosomal protein S14